MNKIIIAVLIFGVFGPGFYLNVSRAEYIGICDGEKLIYAQDVKNSAILNNRLGNRIATVNQIENSFIKWPLNYEINVVTGESLRYQIGDKNSNHFLTFDLLDANHNLIRKIAYSANSKNSVVIIDKTGFIRFNAGDLAREQNLLVLCPSAKPTPSINHSPIWFAMPDQFGFTGQGMQFSIAATDPDGQNLSYKVSNLPEGAIFDTNTRVFTWVPDSNQSGKHVLKFLASDGSFYNEMSVTIYIYPSYAARYYQFPNTLKFFDFNPPILAEEGKLYISTLQVSGGSNLFYRIIEGPKGLYVDEQYGILSWIPDNTQGRSDPYLITIGVSNGKAEVAKSFYVKVKDKK